MRGTHRNHRRRPALPTAVSLVAILFAASCGGETTAPDTTDVASPTVVQDADQEASTPPPLAADDEPDATPTSQAAAPTTSAPTSTTTAGPVTGLPGEAVDDGSVLFLPPVGATLTVLGVAHDDVLNVRARPGVDQPVVTTLEPTDDRIRAAGRHRRLSDGSVWYEIEATGRTGWANSRHLTYLGPTWDSTSYVVDQIGGYPTAGSIEELGLLVADLYTDPELSTVQLSVAPSFGDLAEITYDVIGLGDDSVWGARIHVFGAPTEEGEAGYALKSVEVTDLCLRGGSPDGLCV